MCKPRVSIINSAISTASTIEAGKIFKRPIFETDRIMPNINPTKGKYAIDAANSSGLTSLFLVSGIIVRNSHANINPLIYCTEVETPASPKVAISVNIFTPHSINPIPSAEPVPSPSLRFKSTNGL